MLWLSELMLENYNLNTFGELEEKVREKAGAGELFFRMDVKPTYFDTPDNWEDRLESVFTAVLDQRQ